MSLVCQIELKKEIEERDITQNAQLEAINEKRVEMKQKFISEVNIYRVRKIFSIILSFFQLHITFTSLKSQLNATPVSWFKFKKNAFYVFLILVVSNCYRRSEIEKFNLNCMVLENDQ